MGPSRSPTIQLTLHTEQTRQLSGLTLFTSADGDYHSASPLTECGSRSKTEVRISLSLSLSATAQGTTSIPETMRSSSSENQQSLESRKVEEGHCNSSKTSTVTLGCLYRLQQRVASVLAPLGDWTPISVLDPCRECDHI